MLKFGLETECCHLSFQNKRMDIFQFIDFAADTGFDGVVINVIEKRNLQEGLGALGKDNPEHIKKVAQKIKERGLYVSVDTRGTSFEHLSHMLDVADMLGADLLRTFVMVGNSFSHTNLVGEFSQEGMDQAYEDLKKIVPLCEKKRIKLAIENHCAETMTEVMDLVNRVDSRWVGVLFDYGNAIPVYEDPMHALQLCTDKLFGVHLKDQVICKTGEENELEYCMSETGVGEGACDVIGLSKYIMEHTTLDRLNVETSFPYAGRFTRPVGTGGVTKLGEGAFSFAEPPMPMEKVKPLHYYSYGGEYLDEMIEMQISSLRRGLAYLHRMRDEFEK